MPIYIRVTQDGHPILLGGLRAGPHKGWIEVLSVQKNDSFAPPRLGPNIGTQKPEMSELHIMKYMDMNSAKLFHLTTVPHELKVEIDYTDGKGTAFLSITLHEVMISNYSSSGGGDKPTEDITINFTSATQDKHGVGSDISGTAAPGGWLTEKSKVN